MRAAGGGPLAILFAPSSGVERQARVGRVLWFLLFAWVAAVVLSAAIALRIDARGSTLRQLEESGELKTMSDRQIEEKTKNAARIARVLGIAKGVTGVPLQFGLTCVSVLALTWFLRGRVRGAAVAPVAAATLLPGAIADLLDALSAFRHAAIPPDGVPLAPRTAAAIATVFGRPWAGPWMKLGGALDFYSLWAAVLCAHGVAAAGQVPRRRAIAGTLVAWVCWRLLTTVAIGGDHGGGHPVAR